MQRKTVHHITVKYVRMFCFRAVEMLVCHKVSLKTEAPPGYIQLACSGDVLALPYSRGAIAVWNLRHESAEVLSHLC